MDKLLANQLASLGRDVQLRKANLKNLVSALSHQELRELTSQLSNFDLRTDIVGRLPVELTMLVAGFVERADVANFLNVSKRWRAAWLQEDVLKVLAGKMLPGFLEYVSIREQLTGETQDLPILFSESARKLRSRSLGKFRSAVSVSERVVGSSLGRCLELDPVFHSADRDWKTEYPNLFNSPYERRRPSYSQYSDGRLAWQAVDLTLPASSLVFVDNLRTQLRKIYHMPGLVVSGERVCLKALGDRLVVAVAGRNLVAWDLESNEVQRLTLPCNTRRYATRGHTVVMSVNMGSVVGVWRFGQSLRIFPIPKPTEVLPSQPSPSWKMTYFFDPVRSGTFYGVIINDSSPERRTESESQSELEVSFEVYKFSEGWYTDTFRFSFRKEIGEVFDLVCKQAGSYGDFEIARTHRETSNEYGFPGPIVITNVIFNVFKSSFSVQRHRKAPFVSFPPFNPVTLGGKGSLWNGQLTLACGGGDDTFAVPWGSEDDHARTPIYTLSEEMDENRPGHMRLRRRKKTYPENHGLREGKKGNVGFRKGYAMCDPNFALEFSTSVAQSMADRWTVTGISQDDDFIVVEHSQGYVVWSFETDMIADKIAEI